MATCPNCKYEFFDYKRHPDLIPENGKVLAHDCISGYIRAYPHYLCHDCFLQHQRDHLPISGSFSIAQRELVKENRRRKLAYFRDMDMKSKYGRDIPEDEEELTEDQPISEA